MSLTVRSAMSVAEEAMPIAEGAAEVTDGTD